MPVPYHGQEFTFHQPDGTPVVVRGFGDQHHAVFETVDGFTVVRHPVTGFYHLADVSEDGRQLVPTAWRAGDVDGDRMGLARGMRIDAVEARREAVTAYRELTAGRRCEIERLMYQAQLRGALAKGDALLAPPPIHTIGDYVGLCLLLAFPDVSPTVPQQEVERFCNEPGYQGNGNRGSVCDYFRDVSGGRVGYTNTVTWYYTARNPRRYYTDPAVPYGVRAGELIGEALVGLKAQGFSFDQLSVDGGGNVHAINAFYVGPCVNNYKEGLWPHASYLCCPVELAPGKRAHDYQITNIGNALTLGTFCHENGHMLCKFRDLYDLGGQSHGVGYFCLMCYGGAVPTDPLQFCGYLRHRAGWADSAVELAGVQQVALSAERCEVALCRKGPAEYFVIENRERLGRDAWLPDAGLAIWHVDELGSNDTEAMTPAAHYECSLEQADGLYDLEKKMDAGEPGDLYAGAGAHFGENTRPSSQWWDGTPSGLEISGVSVCGPSMAFTARAPRRDAPVA